ncbi:MAG: Gldg family protein [Kangiellaceae bacterium]|jgi:hypothetical protein|nr:Gldg family protein [Kangiellaceae bacterium]
MSPVFYCVTAIFLLICSLYLNQFTYQYLQLLASNSNYLSVSNAILAPLDSLALLVFLVAVPIINSLGFPRRKQSGLQQLLLSYPVSRQQIWLADWFAMVVVIVSWQMILIVLKSPILLSHSVDTKLLIFRELAFFFTILSISTVVLALQVRLDHSILSNSAGIIVLLLLWLIQSTMELNNFSPTARLASPLQWFAQANAGNIYLSYLVLLSSFSLIIVGFSSIKVSSTLRPILISLSLLLSLIIFYLLPVKPYDVTSNQRFSVSPLLVEKLANYTSINVTTYGLSNEQNYEVILRLYTPLLKIFDGSSLLEKQQQYTVEDQTKSGILVSLDEEEVWIDYPFTKHPQLHLFEKIVRLQQQQSKWILFTEGNGEASIHKQQQRHLSQLNNLLKIEGYKAIQQPLSNYQEIPENTQLIVIASARTEWSEHDQIKIIDFLENGGSLLWLRDPDDQDLPLLQSYLGVDKITGTIVDPIGYQNGTPHPAVALIKVDQQHPTLVNVSTYIALPWSSPLKYQPTDSPVNWNKQNLLTTNKHSWNETDLTNEQINYDANSNERLGQLTVGLALTRKNSRVAIIGDSHFVADMAINNFDNQLFASNLFKWLFHEKIDSTQSIAQPVDRVLEINQLQQHLIGWLFPFVLPGLSILMALYIWQTRKPK